MLVVVDVKKENLFNYIKMKQNMQWREWKLKEKETRKRCCSLGKEKGTIAQNAQNITLYCTTLL